MRKEMARALMTVAMVGTLTAGCGREQPTPPETPKKPGVEWVDTGLERYRALEEMVRKGKVPTHPIITQGAAAVPEAEATAPTATPTITETPTPSCPAVTGPFAAVWQAEQDRLGCAVNEAHTTWMAEEHFEYGRMFWRKDSDRILAVHDSGVWASYQDIWQEGDPDYSCPDSAPEESPPTPLRGFGKIWCTYTEVRNGLGWATDGERGFDGTVQDFEQGAILRTDTGEMYVLFNDGTWTQW